jgi:hypothetical protein
MTSEAWRASRVPPGRNPDETPSMADETSPAFASPREGDHKSRPGREDSRTGVGADEPYPKPYPDSPPSPLVAALAAAFIEVTKKRAVLGQASDGTFGPMTDQAPQLRDGEARMRPGRPSLSVIGGGLEELEAS